jgi:hypothetical protein
VCVVAQLIKCQEMGYVLEHFQEMDIRFAPSYKYDKGTDNFDSRYGGVIL